MAGVQLDPPSAGLRWGRRVCAEAVEAGVLLRPLGDVVVVMPILTSTEPEIDRIADVLEAAVRRGVPVSGWESWADAQLREIKANGRWRRLRALEGKGPRFVCDGRSVVSFASNDYLGLSGHPAVCAAAAEAAERAGTGSGSSRLIVGNRDIHAELEESIAEWTGSEAALVFASGYQANVGVIATLGAGAIIVSDELNHASIIDGARLARSQVAVYRHGDLDHAADLVACGTGPGARGKRHGVLHGRRSGRCGRPVGPVRPAGCASGPGRRPRGVPPAADAAIGPVRESRHAVEGSRISGRFRCGGPALDRPSDQSGPVVHFQYRPGAPSAAAARVAIDICRSPEGENLRAILRRHTDTIRSGHPSPIIPVVVGDETSAMAAADRLLGAGLLVPAIRPPTVPPGTSRLRVSLSAAHDREDVLRLAKALAEL